MSARLVLGQPWCWVNFARSLTADADVDATGASARFSQIYGNLYFPDTTSSGTVYRLAAPHTGTPGVMAFSLGIDSATDPLGGPFPATIALSGPMQLHRIRH